MNIDDYSTDTITVTLEDISSKLNPLFFRIELFDKTGLSSLLIPGKTIFEFREVRDNIGFSTNIVSSYSDLFEKEIIEKYFTFISCANINITAEEKLESLYTLRTEDSAAASVFRYGTIQKYRSQKKLILQPDLKEIFGSNYQIIVPIINTAPIINVNYAPEKLIREILSFPFGEKKIEDHKEKADKIITQREYSKIDQETLHKIIQAELKQERIYEYLGTKTWFWKIEAALRNQTITVIAAVTYPDEKLKIIEVRY